jgi:glycerophosphoryl diester phosphodiesterase
MSTSYPIVRAGLAGALTLATVLVLVLVPDAVQAYAPNLIGALREPGEPAFVAGHRGDRADAPENTIPAFEAAFASGLQIVETDVQLTADGFPVLLHDPTVDRTTDGAGAVADLTLAQVEALDAGSWYSADFAGTRIPLFGELLDLLVATPHTKALVELKEYWTREQIRGLLAEIYQRGVQNRIVFAGFHLGTLSNLADVAGAIPRVIIRRDLPADPVGLAAFYGAIAIMTSPWSLETYPDAVADMHAAGYGVLLYTLNSEKRWTEATAYGVDGIVTDAPSALDDWIAQTAPGT